MELFEWLHRTKTSQRALAEKVGTSLNTLSTIVNNRRTPGLELAIRIHLATDKMVGIETMLSTGQGKKLKEFIETENIEV